MRVRLNGVYASWKTKADGRVKHYCFLRRVGAINPPPGDENSMFAPGQPAFMRAVASPEILLAFELALATGQRKGDPLALS